jgi:imidazole glycerol phosphate synthase glutamine amidotransferase subunit
MEVLVIRTGTANIASVVAGLRRAGAAPRVSADPRDVERSRRAVLPGVGTVAAAMERIGEAGLESVLRERLMRGRPTLCVCLGLQLLCDGSEESPEVGALGVVSGVVTRFRSPQGSGKRLRVPQLGWNRVSAGEGCRLLEDGYAYFANSYKLDEVPDGWSAALSDHGGPFVAAMERGAVLACQFHPELSGHWGLSLIRRWLDAGGEVPC